MRKLLILAGVCFVLNATAQRDWKNYSPNSSTIDSHSWMEDMCYDDEFTYTLDYKPDMSIRESRKTKRRLRKARKGKNRLANANFEVIPDRDQLTVTAFLDATDQSSYHLKLTNKKGKVIKSFLHLSPQTVQEIQLMQLLPGKYQLSLYAGIERRLVSRYDVNRY